MASGCYRGDSRKNIFVVVETLIAECCRTHVTENLQGSAFGRHHKLCVPVCVLNLEIRNNYFDYFAIGRWCFMVFETSYQWCINDRLPNMKGRELSSNKIMHHAYYFFSFRSLCFFFIFAFFFLFKCLHSWAWDWNSIDLNFAVHSNRNRNGRS